MKTLSVTKEGDRCGYHRTAVVLMALVLVSVLLISMAPVSEAETAGECGTELSWTLTENTDVPGTYTLTIDGNGTSMTDYNSVSHPGWYDFNSTITSLVLPTGLTHIGAYAFYNLSALAETNVSQLDSLTSIGEYAFAGTSITSMDLSGTEITSVEEGTFWQCRTLANVELPTTVTAIGIGAFSATGLQSINFEALYNLSSIDRSAFESSKITTADLSNTDLTTIADGAFHYNDSLTSVTIPPSVTTISGQSFNQCGALTSLIIPKGSSLTSIGESAFSATGLTSVDLSGAAGLTTLGDNAFGDCPSLTQVKVPETFTIPTSAFEGSPVEGIWTASVGDRYFDNLADAFGEAADGETIKLLKSIEIDTCISISDGRDLTLDLGEGNDISSSDNWAIFIIHGGLKIEGRGTISAPMTKIGAIGISGSTDPAATDYSTLEIGDNVTIMGYWGLDVQETVSGNGTVYGIVVDIHGHAEGLTDTSKTGYHGGALYVSGNIHGHDGNLPVINIHDSAVITGNADALGIYGAGQAIWNIDAATISGSTGIEIRNGTINIDGATVTSTVDDYSVMSNGSGRTTTGAAIAITSYYPTEEDTPTMEIVSGTFTGPVSVSQTNPNSISGAMYEISILGGTFTSTGTDSSTGNTYSAVIAENANAFIMGGTYSDKPDSNYFTNGYQSSDITDEDGNFTVVTTEDPVVVNESTGQEYATLQDALDAAQDGETIRLLKDIVLGGDGNNPGAIIKSGVTIDGSKPDGGVFMISSSTALKVLATVNEASFGDVLTLKNLKVENTSGIKQARCLDTRGLSSGLALDGVTLTVPEGSETQPLTIGGECSSVLKIEITKTVIQSSAKGYAIIIFNPVDMTITNSQLSGWAVIYLKDKNVSAGSSGSNVFVSDSKIVSTNSQRYDSSGNEDFGAIVVNDRGVTVELSNVDVTIETTDGNEQKLFSSDIKSQASTTGSNTFRIGGEETEVTFIGSNTTFAFDSHNISTFEVTGGTYSKDVSDYLAPGLMVESDGSGVFKVVEAPETGLGVTYDPINPTDDQDVTVTATVTGVPEGTMITYIWNDEETTTTTDTTMTFTVAARDSTEQTLSVSFTAYGDDKTFSWSHTFFVNRTVTVTFPDALGIADQQFSVRDGETFDVPFSEIEVPDGFLVTGYDYEGQPVTSDLEVTVECILESPTVSYTIDYHDGYTLVSVTYGHVLGDSVMFAMAMFDSDNPGFGPDGNTFTIRESGTYTLQVSCALIADKDIWGIYSVDIPIEVGSDTGIVIPPTDDDDYVPPIYVPSGSSSSDDDTVKIVACAAAAVVAAIMAAFLILGHRRE